MTEKSSFLEKIKLRIVNLIRSKKAVDTRWFLYEIIDKTPNLTIYELADKVNWPLVKINYHIKKLVKDGIVKIKDNQKYYPTPFGELINWDKMTNTGRPEGC